MRDIIRGRSCATLLFLAGAAASGATAAGGSGRSATPQLDVGTVRQGDAIRWWARFANPGAVTLYIHQDTSVSVCAPLPPPVALLLTPGTSAVVELPPIYTRGFRGPVSKTLLLECEPACTMSVELWGGAYPVPKL